MLFGKKLCEEAEAAERYIGNALKRMLKCPPPEDLCRHAWTKMGKTDMNDLPIFKPNFHSCGSGNMNSQQMGYVPGGHCRKETATALFYEGNAASIMKKEVHSRTLTSALMAAATGTSYTSIHCLA